MTADSAAGAPAADAATGAAESVPEQATTRPIGPTRLTKARRRAIDILFEADQRDRLSGGALLELLDERKITRAREAELPEYAETVVRGVATHLEGIDRTIRTYVQGWTLERLPAVDRAILRAALWELVFNEDVDAPVTITEAMMIAAELSTDDSPAFINAVLDRVNPLVSLIRADIEAG